MARTPAAHDPGILIFCLFVPLAYPLLYSYVYTNEVVREVPAAVVNDSRSSLSRDFLRRLDGTPDMALTHHCSSMSEAQTLLKRQEVYGIIHIPESFARDIDRGDQTYVGLYCDLSSMLTPHLIPPVLMLILQQTLLLGVDMPTGRRRERYPRGLFI